MQYSKRGRGKGTQCEPEGILTAAEKDTITVALSFRSLACELVFISHGTGVLNDKGQLTGLTIMAETNTAQQHGTIQTV